jgi:hypothetical protein
MQHAKDSHDVPARLYQGLRTELIGGACTAAHHFLCESHVYRRTGPRGDCGSEESRMTVARSLNRPSVAAAGRSR